MDISHFFKGLTEEQIGIYEGIHQLAMSYDLVLEMKYEIPFYVGKSWICYLNPIKKNGVEWAFTRGNELNDDLHILNFKGRKQVGGIELFTPDSSLLERGEIILQEAIILDQNVPYKSKRKKKK